MHGVRAISALSLVALASLAGSAGCSRDEHPSQYQALSGLVEARDTQKGELTVRVTPRRRRDGPPQAKFCVVTKDSEIYVNEVFSDLDEVQVGDAVDLIVYRDANPQLEQYVVSFAHVRRAQASATTPPAVTPDQAP